MLRSSLEAFSGYLALSTTMFSSIRFLLLIKYIQIIKQEVSKTSNKLASKCLNRKVLKPRSDLLASTSHFGFHSI